MKISEQANYHVQFILFDHHSIFIFAKIMVWKLEEYSQISRTIVLIPLIFFPEVAPNVTIQCSINKKEQLNAWMHEWLLYTYTYKEVVEFY